MITSNPTKKKFVEAYKKELISRYAWAAIPHKLDKFMKSVQETLDGGNSFVRNGEAYFAALKTVGLPKNTTLKGLQALPKE